MNPVAYNWTPSGRNGEWLRVRALELAESLVGRQIAVGLVKTGGAPMTKRVVDAAETLLEFLMADDRDGDVVDEKMAADLAEQRARLASSGDGTRCASCGYERGHALDCDQLHLGILAREVGRTDLLAASNGDAAPRPSATDTQHVGGPASAPAAPVERHERAVVQRVLGHPIDSTGLTPDGRPLFTSGIERDTLDVIRDAHRVPDQATRAVVKQVTDKALLAAGITPETPGAVFYLTEAEGRALVDELDALLADGAPQADVPPPAPAASPNDAWLGAMTLLDTAIVRSNAKGKRTELIDLICNVNHAARIEDVPPDALEAAAQEVEGLVGALGTGLIGLLRDRAAMRGR